MFAMVGGSGGCLAVAGDVVPGMLWDGWIALSFEGDEQVVLPEKTKLWNPKQLKTN